MLLLVPFLAFAQQDKMLVENGNAYYRKGNFAMADSLYQQSQNINPQLEAAQFNLGNARYREGKFEEAAESFGKLAAGSKHLQTKQEAYYNQGNALLSAQQFDKSIEAYKQALRLNPQDEDSRYNLSYAMQMMQQQQQQEQQQQDENKDGEQKDDENKSGDQNGDQNKENSDNKDSDSDEEKSEKEGNQKDQKPGDQSESDKEQQQTQTKAGEISKEDAARLLKALENEEKAVQMKLNKEKGKGKDVKIEKDW